MQGRANGPPGSPWPGPYKRGGSIDPYRPSATFPSGGSESAGAALCPALPLPSDTSAVPGNSHACRSKTAALGFHAFASQRNAAAFPSVSAATAPQSNSFAFPSVSAAVPICTVPMRCTAKPKLCSSGANPRPATAVQNLAHATARLAIPPLYNARPLRCLATICISIA